MRWLPALSMMLVSVISYIDRNTLALLAPTILKDIGLSNEQYGYIIAAFSVAYCIGNPAWGRILDRFGVHIRYGGIGFCCGPSLRSRMCSREGWAASRLLVPR